MALKIRIVQVGRRSHRHPDLCTIISMRAAGVESNLHRGIVTYSWHCGVICRIDNFLPQRLANCATPARSTLLKIAGTCKFQTKVGKSPFRHPAEGSACWLRALRPRSCDLRRSAPALDSGTRGRIEIMAAHQFQSPCSAEAQSVMPARYREESSARQSRGSLG